MDRYDYKHAAKEDAVKWLQEHVDLKDWTGGRDVTEEDRLKLLDCLEDHIHSIAKKGANSNLSIEEARECLRYNYDILYEALKEQMNIQKYCSDEKEMDLTVREYLLPSCLEAAVDEFIKLSVPEI